VFEIWSWGCGRGICRLVCRGEGGEKCSSGGLPLNKIGRLGNYRAAAVMWQRFGVKVRTISLLLQAVNVTLEAPALLDHCA
jgi:hypothetical protein